jgi:hypothetical protein
MDKGMTKLDALLGRSVIAGTVTGFFALVAALFAFIEGDWAGTGLCLAAAALAFGLVSNAMLRD